MEIRLAASAEDLEQVKHLFREYFEWIRRDLEVNMSYQGVEDELASLPGAFSLPDGCLLLAESDGQTVGCVALRRHDTHTCELKRMYVKPEYRGRGIGRALGGRIIHEAKRKGYQLMVLDTEVSLKNAQQLYDSLGFKLTQQYYEVPPDILKRTIFMELALQ